MRQARWCFEVDQRGWIGSRPAGVAISKKVGGTLRTRAVSARTTRSIKISRVHSNFSKPSTPRPVRIESSFPSKNRLLQS